jgi:hypothetical protein
MGGTNIVINWQKKTLQNQAVFKSLERYSFSESA